MSILAEIVENKRSELVEAIAQTPLDRIRAEAEAFPPPPPFAEALRSVPMGLIAEVKRRSPSAGAIREPFDPSAVAAAYEQAGAQAVSTLMDKVYFGGGEEDFQAVRKAIRLPMLYKEFVVDPWQIWHARKLGASAVLLIVAALDANTLKRLYSEVLKSGLDVLVETHNEDEMKIAAGLGASCIGINNRNLKTFEVSLETTFKLKEWAPAGATLISESGIRTAADVKQLQQAGAHAVLVGEQLLRQADVSAAVKNLMEQV